MRFFIQELQEEIDYSTISITRYSVYVTNYNFHITDKDDTHKMSTS